MKIGLQGYIQGTVEAAEFYQKAFGATLGYNVRNADGTFMHAELNLDGQLLIALSETSSSVGLENIKRYSPSDYPTMNFSVSLGSEEAVKKAYEVFIEQGNILLPIGPLPWNTCCANVIDKFGVFWYISV
ncbi:VOC family protein [Clostridium sp. C8-1-8]|uniref:VOC family protein n=1 Tax=Clostridium sp. C8-1-8 TaxID=2698831 RepID=UPI00136A509A|nr:VOC family protein [Clostridium sp. C8-1-8]